MIRIANPSDLNALAELALLLWPNHTFDEMRLEIESLLSNPNAALFLYFDGDLPAGFAQCQLRHDYVEGTESSPVGYLEGVFVLESHRGRGIAAQLLTHCERWAAEKGCAEFASDYELDNAASYTFHINHGFREANRVICFHKMLHSEQD
jgi:aminoglycoside 6'-N-acetyltransferase I